MNSKIIRETSGFPIAFPVLLIFQSVVICFIMVKDHESPWVVIGITVPIALLLFFSRLNIRMDASHFEYYFFPFMFRRKKIRWNEIREIRLVNTDPIWDFGGWGVRLSKKYGKAFITGGNDTVFLLLKNGKRRSFSIKSKTSVKHFFDEHAIAYEENL
ncbi:hypothetical protein [uncultured Chryseobacterium sp.]|uniref:hypothetical protein n=1 Tax=uncultured Chryseobacterium sp. TaxID=259322 RepID=UPI0025E5B32B|nr:hypothetical protein [uncultured Chryseobacterium sp.]